MSENRSSRATMDIEGSRDTVSHVLTAQSSSFSLLRENSYQESIIRDAAFGDTFSSNARGNTAHRIWPRRFFRSAVRHIASALAKITPPSVPRVQRLMDMAPSPGEDQLLGRLLCSTFMGRFDIVDLPPLRGTACRRRLPHPFQWAGAVLMPLP